MLSQLAGSPARLWNRVGLYRVLSVVLLVGAVAGGVAVAADRSTQRPAAASKSAANPGSAQAPDAEAQRAEAERAARQDAQRKADAAAIAAAETAKASAKPSTKASASAKPSKSAVPPKPPLPIPASCAVYGTSHKATGCAAVLAQGWSLAEMACLEKLWDKESHWNPLAHNNGSGAHGIPQAVPGSKMGPGWESDPVVQINWGIGYIKGRYGRPCVAWAHSQSTGWY